MSDGELEKAIRSILKETDGIFEFASIHGMKWEGGDIVPKLMEKVKSRDQQIALAARIETLQWVEDLGKDGTQGASVHNMNEYDRRYGAAVSFKVHDRLYTLKQAQKEE